MRITYLLSSSDIVLLLRCGGIFFFLCLVVVNSVLFLGLRGVFRSVVLCLCIAKIWTLAGIGCSALCGDLACGLYLVSNYGTVST